MGAWGASLDPADVQRARSKLDLIPPQVHKLCRPEAMPIGRQDHGGVAMPPTVLPGGGHQPFDLGLCQVLTGAEGSVGKPLGCDCSFYSGWRDQLEVRLCHVFGSSSLNDCSDNARSSNCRSTQNPPLLMSHFDSDAASIPLATVSRTGGAQSMSYVVLTLLLAVLFGLDGPEALLAVLFAAFLIYVMR